MFLLFFQGFVLVVCFVCFWTGGSSEIDQKHCAGHQKQRVHKINKNRSRARFGIDFGVLLGVSLVTNVFFSWKSECEKTDRKTGTPKSETRDYGRGPGLPDSPPLKSKIEQQLNNKQQQFNNSTQTLTIAELLLQFDLLFLCFVWFQIQNDVVFVSCWISKSRAMIWHALGKARRIKQHV